MGTDPKAKILAQIARRKELIEKSKEIIEKSDALVEQSHRLIRSAIGHKGNNRKSNAPNSI